MGMFDHSSRSAFVRSGTDVDEKAWLHSNLSQRGSIGLRSKLCAGQAPKLVHPCLYGPCFVQSKVHKDVEELDWPALSPDLNPLEHF